MDLLPKMQVNIVLSDHNVEKAIETIIQATRTGKEGDGLIFIYPVEDVIDVQSYAADEHVVLERSRPARPLRVRTRASTRYLLGHHAPGLREQRRTGRCRRSRA
ncbi:MAG: P-II family nitrogen regulator, partial [Anaerolineales bacterium]|nr:P-II family nitrogen regulator [Anaerolineales bacterium]